MIRLIGMEDAGQEISMAEHGNDGVDANVVAINHCYEEGIEERSEL